MALTDIKITIIDKTGGDRVAIRFLDPVMSAFIKKNKVYVLSRVWHKPILLMTEDRDTTLVDTDLVSAVVRVVQRCADKISDNRTIESLATFAQLERMLQLAEILAKRPDNAILLPAGLWKLTHGQSGRWIADAKTLLAKEGRWDDTKKAEIPKKSRKEKNK